MTNLLRVEQRTEHAPARIAEVDPRHDQRWHTYVTAHPNAFVYHHPAWLQVVEDAYGCRPAHLACEAEDGTLSGVLPLFHSRGLLTGSRLTSLPHTPVAGPLADDPAVAAALVRSAVERLRVGSSAHLQIKTAATGLDATTAGVVGGPWRTTYVLELPDANATPRFGNARNHSRITWAVNKAARHGVRVRTAETEAELRGWYRLYLDTERWHGLPPPPYRFFRIAWEYLRPLGMLRLLLAEQVAEGRSRLIAGSIFLMFGRTVFYAYNGRRRADLALRPNDAIHWQAIHDAHREGYRYYDFGEVAAGSEGLAEFKGKWGTEEQQLHRYYFPTTHELESGALDQRSRSRRLARSIWRRMPLPITEVLGSRLYCSL